MQAQDLAVSWAGRVGASTGDPVSAYRAARTLERALRSGGPPIGDHRLGLAVLWARVESCTLLQEDDLHLLLVATSPEGTAVSAVGIDHLFAGEKGGQLRPWLRGPHPMFSPPGRPSAQPGALTVPDAPEWLIATYGVDVDTHSLDDVLPSCGVHR